MIWREPARLFQHGGSYAVRMPPKIREALNLRPGDLVLLTLVDDCVVLVRYDAERILPRQQARSLVSRVQAENGAARG